MDNWPWSELKGLDVHAVIFIETVTKLKEGKFDVTLSDPGIAIYSDKDDTIVFRDMDNGELVSFNKKLLPSVVSILGGLAASEAQKEA